MTRGSHKKFPFQICMKIRHQLCFNYERWPSHTQANHNYTYLHNFRTSALHCTSCGVSQVSKWKLTERVLRKLLTTADYWFLWLMELRNLNMMVSCFNVLRNFSEIIDVFCRFFWNWKLFYIQKFLYKFVNIITSLLKLQVKLLLVYQMQKNLV